jgi:hypothetical protein
MATRGSAQGADLSGIWTMVVSGDALEGLAQVKVSFNQDGPNLLVTLHAEGGDVECDGFIEGRSIRFYYVRTAEDGQLVAKFTGRIAGAVMGGEVDLGELGKTTWRASRNI